jgi:hypothetical protein
VAVQEVARSVGADVACKDDKGIREMVDYAKTLPEYKRWPMKGFDGEGGTGAIRVDPTAGRVAEVRGRRTGDTSERSSG